MQNTEDVSEHSAENIWTYEGDSKNIHNEELHNLYPPPNITRIIIIIKDEYVAGTGEKRNAYEVGISQ